MYLLFRIIRKIVVLIDYLIYQKKVKVRTKDIRKIIVDAFLLEKQDLSLDASAFKYAKDKCSTNYIFCFATELRSLLFVCQNSFYLKIFKHKHGFNQWELLHSF